MDSRPLDNVRILVVEDDYLLAMMLSETLTMAGASIVGPASNVAQAQEFIGSADCIDAAVLDVNLGREMVYPVADTLTGLDVPFLLTTGYDGQSLETRFADHERCEKPFDPEEIVLKLSQMMGLTGLETLPDG